MPASPPADQNCALTATLRQSVLLNEWSLRSTHHQLKVVLQFFIRRNHQYGRGPGCAFVNSELNSLPRVFRTDPRNEYTPPVVAIRQTGVLFHPLVGTAPQHSETIPVHPREQARSIWRCGLSCSIKSSSWKPSPLSHSSGRQFQVASSSWKPPGIDRRLS